MRLSGSSDAEPGRLKLSVLPHSHAGRQAGVRRSHVGGADRPSWSESVPHTAALLCSSGLKGSATEAWCCSVLPNLPSEKWRQGRRKRGRERPASASGLLVRDKQRQCISPSSQPVHRSARRHEQPATSNHQARRAACIS